MGAPVFSLPTSLVVPVDVAAFCVGADDVAGTVDGAPYGTQYFAGTTPDFSKLPYLRNGDYGSNERLNLSEVVLATAQPFSQVSKPLLPGVHLHWALPDALTHGVAAGAGATAVAAVAGGQVTGVTVTGGGSGYTYPPAVVLTGTGTGASAYTTVNPAGEVVAVSVTNGGTNYTTPPTVTLQPTLGFPEAPNRWAVVRIVANATTGATSHRAWVVESDHLWDATPGQPPSGPNSASIAVPVRPSPTNTSDNQAFRQQGWVTPLPKWSEPTGAPAVERLTALGYGDVTYAASYRSCHNVFGFWDSLDDLGSGGSGYDKDRPDDARLSYLVMGWHNSSASDPLATLGTGDDFAAEMAARLAWSVSSLPEGSPRPVQSVYHGLVRAITWDAGHTYVGPKTGAPLEVALGNNLPEALAALLATELTGRANLERVLCALQLGVLSQLDVTGALPAGRLADFEEALHASEFKPSPGGTLWLVKRSVPAGTGGGATTSGLTEAAAQLGVTLPDELAAKLNRLNSAQQELDELSGEIGSMRDQNLCRLVQVHVPAVGGDGARVAREHCTSRTTRPGRSRAGERVHRVRGRRPRAVAAALQHPGPTPPTGTGDGGLLYQRQQLEAALAATGSNGYQLTSVSAPRYWQPNDPVVLIAGPDAHAPARHGQDGRDQPDNTLRCRLGTDVIDTMHVGDGAGSAVSAGDVLALASPGGSGLDGTLQALLAEAYFVDPDRAWLLSRALSRRGGAIGLDQAIAAAQQRLLAAGASPGTTPEAAPTITFAGAVPSPIGVNAWSGNPWLPLSLEWEVNYVDPLRSGPAPGPAYRTDYLSTNFAWGDDDIDLVFEGAVPPALPAGETYRGAVALSGNADINLRGQLSRYLDSDPKSEYAGQLAALIKLPALPMLAQSLSGFNEALVMRRQTLQVPVSDPLAIKISRILSQFSNVTVANAVQDRNRTAPLPHNAYNPFRAGFMQLTRARLVDAFGQFRDIDVSKVMAAESMRAPGGSTAIVLPPRLSQPSRLLFRWLSADDDQVEMNTHPATTPICGWVLFNHVDDALMIYDAAGVPLASLNVRGALCRGAPGSQASFTRPCSEIFEHANPHLRDFVASITGREPLAELLSAIDRSVTTIDPANSKQDTGLSVLIGRPLAIVRASLSLDLAGLPALDQSWASFASAVAATSGPAPVTVTTPPAATSPRSPPSTSAYSWATRATWTTAWSATS